MMKKVKLLKYQHRLVFFCYQSFSGSAAARWCGQNGETHVQSLRCQRWRLCWFCWIHGREGYNFGIKMLHFFRWFTTSWVMEAQKKCLLRSSVCLTWTGASSWNQILIWIISTIRCPAPPTTWRNSLNLCPHLNHWRQKLCFDMYQSFSPSDNFENDSHQTFVGNCQKFPPESNT